MISVFITPLSRQVNGNAPFFRAIFSVLGDIERICSDDVRTPYESAPDDGDFDALRPVLITDSTSEIADDPEKPNTVKFAWRYAENRIAQRNPLGLGIFTEPYDFTFR